MTIRYLITAASVGIIGLLCACQTETAGEPQLRIVSEDVSMISDSLFIKETLPMAETLIRGLVEGDLKQILRHCTVSFRDRVNDKNVTEQARLIRTNYGTFVRLEYGMNCRQLAVRALICKAVFTRKDKKGVTEIREIPLTLHIAPEDGTLKIFSFTLSPL